MLATPVPYNAAVAALAALAEACGDRPKAGRKERRRAIERLEAMQVHPTVRAQAIDGIRRTCGSCGRCKGV